MPPEHYEQAVARAVELISDGRMEKIVLAREVQVHAPRAYDPAAVFGVLREEFPSCFVLLRRARRRPRSSPRARSCWCAARGSASARSRSPARRAAAPTRPSTTTSASSCCAIPSYREEHAIVARRIERTLRPHAVWVAAAPEPELVRIANIQHLATPIRAQLAAPIEALELAGLHAPDARRRRRAAGAAAPSDPGARGARPRLVPRPGRLDATRRATASSASRCAARCSAARSRAATPGDGIVRDSDPSSELAETEVKLQALLPLLSG